jgi:hypothetical protein
MAVLIGLVGCSPGMSRPWVAPPRRPPRHVPGRLPPSGWEACWPASPLKGSRLPSNASDWPTQVGRDRFEVLDALITYIAGSGSDLEAQAARNAACDILDELFPEGVDYDDLTAVVIDAAALELMLTLFLAAYIYNRMPIIAERLTRLGDRHAAERADGELRDYIRAYVDLQLGDDPLAIDWTGAEGRLVIEQAIQAVYALLEAYEADESGEP